MLLLLWFITITIIVMTYIMIILTHLVITIIITVTFIIAMVMTILPNTVARSFSTKDGFRAVINPLTAKWALRALIDFILSNARRFYSSMGNPLAGKGLRLAFIIYDAINHRFLINPNVYSNSLILEMYIHLQNNNRRPRP